MMSDDEDIKKGVKPSDVDEQQPDDIDALRASQRDRLIGQAGHPIQRRRTGADQAADAAAEEAAALLPEQAPGRSRWLTPEAWISLVAIAIIGPISALLLKRLGGELSQGTTPYVLSVIGCAVFLVLAMLQISILRGRIGR